MNQSQSTITPSLARLVLFSLALAFASLAFANEVIFTWTDDEGVRHFSAQPPEGREYRVVEALISPTAPEPQRTTPDTLPPAALMEISQAEPDPDLVRERCEMARNNLDLLRQDRPALLRQDDGEEVAMDDEARRQMIEELETFVIEWC
ncbi:MAG: DUF4124 domain-containing protein [Wenzhouxiangella sp.]